MLDQVQPVKAKKSQVNLPQVKPPQVKPPQVKPQSSNFFEPKKQIAAERKAKQAKSIQEQRFKQSYCIYGCLLERTKRCCPIAPAVRAFQSRIDKVINLGIPHVGELIFESIDTPGLFQFALVSETWKILAENVLIKRWKGKMLEACKNGETKVVQFLLEMSSSNWTRSFFPLLQATINGV